MYYTPPTYAQRCVIHVGHLRLAMPTTHALAQTCVLLCPLCPNLVLSLSYPALLLAKGSTTPFLIINYDTLQIKGLAKNPLLSHLGPWVLSDYGL